MSEMVLPYFWFFSPPTVYKSSTTRSDKELVFFKDTSIGWILNFSTMEYSQHVRSYNAPPKYDKYEGYKLTFVSTWKHTFSEYPGVACSWISVWLLWSGWFCPMTTTKEQENRNITSYGHEKTVFKEEFAGSSQYNWLFMVYSDSKCVTNISKLLLAHDWWLGFTNVPCVNHPHLYSPAAAGHYSSPKLYSAKLATNLPVWVCQLRLHYSKVFVLTQSFLYKSGDINRISYSVWKSSCCHFLQEEYSAGQYC